MTGKTERTIPGIPAHSVRTAIPSWLPPAIHSCSAWSVLICNSMLACSLILSYLPAGTAATSTTTKTQSKPKTSGSKENLKQIRNRIDMLKKQLADKEVSRQKTASALRESETAIIHVNRRLAGLSSEQRKTSTALDQLTIRTRETRRTIDLQQSRLNRELRQQYVQGQHDYLQLLLNQKNPGQIARDLHYYGYISRARVSHIGTLQTDLGQLDSLTRESHEKSRELAEIQSKQTAQKTTLEQERVKRQQLLAQLSTQVAQHQQEISRLEQDEKQLSQLVARLNRASKNASRKSPPSSRHPAPLNNQREPDASSSGSPFATLQGRLSLPVRGEITHRFGASRNNSKVTWKGLFIRTPDGTAIKAIAAGKVVFSDWLRGFGNLLIIDHGDSYMSLYGNNDVLHRQPGDMVQGGETIAVAGNSSDEMDSGLYFELRYQGKPFDPLNWMTLK